MNKHNKTDSCVLASYLFNKVVPDSEIVKGFSIREIHYCLLVWIEYKNKIYDIANIQFVQNSDMNILSLPQYSMEKPNHLKKKWMTTMKNAIHIYKNSKPRHIIRMLLTMLKSASKLLKEKYAKVSRFQCLYM